MERNASTATTDDGQDLDQWIDEQEELRRRLAREHPKEWELYGRAKKKQVERFQRDPRRKAKVAEFHAARRRGEPASLDLSADWTRAAKAAVASIHGQGRAPRPTTSVRSRGPRRGDRARSSSSDDPDPDPEPRACDWCGASLDHLNADARHCNDAHRASAWRRDEADRDRILAERELVRNDAQLELASPRDARKCVCGGATYRDPEGDLVCTTCGRFADPAHLTSPNGWDARMATFSYLATHRWDGDAWVPIYEHRHRADPPGNDGGLQTRLRGERRIRSSGDREYQVPPTRSGGSTTTARPPVKTAGGQGGDAL